jgi:hypothetical protein
MGGQRNAQGPEMRPVCGSESMECEGRIYLGTVLLEKGRWSTREPSFRVSAVADPDPASTHHDDELHT